MLEQERQNALGQGMWRLARMHTPVGALLLLWPTLWALWAAHKGFPSWELVLIYTVGAVSMRAAGCVVNDMWDKEVDARVVRTSSRPLASGVLSMRQALWTLFGLLAFSALLLFGLPLAVWGVAFAALPLVLLYPLAKRWLPVPQLFLGGTFAWAVPVAYASKGSLLPWECWALYLAVACWVVGYDSVYALLDLEDDAHLPLFSAAKTFGPYVLHWVAACYAFCLLFMALWFSMLSLGRVVFLLWGIMALGLSGQVLYLALGNRSTWPLRAWHAFACNVPIGALMWLGLVCAR